MGAREVDPFRGEPIEVGSLDDRVAGAAHRIRAVLIGEQQQDVGLSGLH